MLQFERNVFVRRYHDKLGVVMPNTLLADHFEKKYKQFMDANKKINDRDTVLIASYFLPVRLKHSDQCGWSVERDPDSLISFDLPYATSVFVGTVRFRNKLIPLEHQAEVTHVLHEHRCHPIFVSENIYHDFYDVWCKDRLWTVLQQPANVFLPIDQLLATIETDVDTQLWISCNALMALFRNKLVELFYANYLVWLHGYEFILLSSYIRRKLITAKIGYFFHSPVHPSENWTVIFRREDLLRGMLGANQIGFHSFEHSKSFVSACCRMLGYVSYIDQYGRLILNVDSNEIIITSIHKGLDLGCATVGSI